MPNGKTKGVTPPPGTRIVIPPSEPGGHYVVEEVLSTGEAIIEFLGLYERKAWIIIPPITPPPPPPKPPKMPSKKTPIVTPPPRGRDSTPIPVPGSKTPLGGKKSKTKEKKSETSEVEGKEESKGEITIDQKKLTELKKFFNEHETRLLNELGKATEEDVARINNKLGKLRAYYQATLIRLHKGESPYIAKTWDDVEILTPWEPK